MICNKHKFVYQTNGEHNKMILNKYLIMLLVPGKYTIFFLSTL